MPAKNLANNEINAVTNRASSDLTTQSNVAEANLPDSVLPETSSSSHCSANQSFCKSMDCEVMLAEIAKLELRGHLHSYYQCKKVDCTKLSIVDESKQKDLKRKFQHVWLEDRSLAFEKTTGIWWLLYLENEGLFCLLCRKHNVVNPSNKSKIFNATPSVRYRKEAINEHSNSKQHQSAVQAEMAQRVSVFHKKVEERELVKDEVLYNAFVALYWLAKESVANKKFFSLLNLFRVTGLTKMEFFPYKSPSTIREMALTLGSVLKESVLCQVRKAQSFGLMIDEVTDIAVQEQLVMFIQFWNRESKASETKFLGVRNLLESSDSANAATITKSVLDELSECGLSVDQLLGLCSDGASVMTGKRNGVAAKLKELNKSLVSVHCICHKLSLACCDTNDEIVYIKEVERWLIQIWKFFENSPKRLAIYFKCQLSIKQLQEPSTKAQKVCQKRLAKATRTRWLSLSKAVEGVFNDYLPLMLTLRKLESTDALAAGLLQKMHSVKFIGVVTIMKHILPVLNKLSCAFQHGQVSFAHVEPVIQKATDDLDQIAQKASPVSEFAASLKQGGRLHLAELTLSETSELYLRNFLRKYSESVKANIKDRFSDAVPLLSAFAIFDPVRIPDRGQPGFLEYGSTQVEQLARHYFSSEDDRQQLKDEWRVFKYELIQWRNEIPEEIKQPTNSKDSPAITPTDWCLQRLLAMNSLSPRSLSLLTKVAESIVSLPVSNAWPERGASALKLIKNRLRSTIKNDMLSSLMQIHVNGPEVGTKNFDNLMTAAVTVWQSKPRRKLLKHARMIRKQANQDESSHSTGQVSETVTVRDAEIQTDDVVATEPETMVETARVEEEVQWVAKRLDLPDIDSDPDSDYGSDADSDLE